MKLSGFSLLAVLALVACRHAVPLATTSTGTVSAPPPFVAVVTTPEPAPETPDVTARVVPTECTEAAAAALFEVTGDTEWRTLCNELDGARYFSAWRMLVGDTAMSATLRLARVAGGAITWETTEEMRSPSVGETWTAEPVRAVAGTPGGLLVSLAGESGEDYYTRSSLTAVFRPTAGGGFERVWTGVGDEFERSMDACLRETTRGFRFVDARTLAVSHVRTVRFVERQFAGDLLSRLRRECTPAPRRVTRVALAR